MARDPEPDVSDRRELMVLSIVPVLVAVLTLASWALAHWHVGPLFVNAGLALIATLFGGFQRFIAGFKDLFSRRITVNVFVVVALIATLAIGEFRPAAANDTEENRVRNRRIEMIIMRQAEIGVQEGKS